MKYLIDNKCKLFLLKDGHVLFKNSIKAKKYKLKPLQQEIIKNIILGNDISIDDEIIDILLKYGIIKRYDSHFENVVNTKFEYTHKYFNDLLDISDDWIQDLGNMTILIIGVGGIGGNLIHHFVANGIKKYILIDGDVIENTNLNRQFLFNICDVGKYKVDVAKLYIEKNIIDAEVFTIKSFVESTEDLIDSMKQIDKQPDIVINSADTPPITIQRIVAEYANHINCPYISGGVGINDFYWGPIYDKREEFDKYINKLTRIESNLLMCHKTKNSFSVTNALLADFMANDIIWFLLDQKKYLIAKNEMKVINIYDI